MLRNPLKRGMDFVFGLLDIESITITSDDGTIRWEETGGETSPSYVLGEVRSPSGDDLDILYNAQYGLLTVRDAESGNDKFRVDLPNGDVRLFDDGAGVRVPDADGSGSEYRIRVNGGTVEAEGPL